MPPQRHSTAFRQRGVPKSIVGKAWVAFEKKSSAEQKARTGKSQRTVVSLKSGLFATVRRFKNTAAATKYVLHVAQAEETILSNKPKHFDLQRIQFISARGASLMERVYPGVECERLIAYIKGKNKGKTTPVKPRFFPLLQKRLKRQKIDLLKLGNNKNITDSIQNALKELHEIILENKIKLNLANVNVLTLNYNPKTKKVLFRIWVKSHAGLTS